MQPWSIRPTPAQFSWCRLLTSPWAGPLTRHVFSSAAARTPFLSKVRPHRGLQKWNSFRQQRRGPFFLTLRPLRDKVILIFSCLAPPHHGWTWGRGNKGEIRKPILVRRGKIAGICTTARMSCCRRRPRELNRPRRKPRRLGSKQQVKAALWERNELRPRPHRATRPRLLSSSAHGRCPPTRDRHNGGVAAGPVDSLAASFECLHTPQGVGRRHGGRNRGHPCDAEAIDCQPGQNVDFGADQVIEFLVDTGGSSVLQKGALACESLRDCHSGLPERTKCRFAGGRMCHLRDGGPLLLG